MMKLLLFITLLTGFLGLNACLHNPNSSNSIDLANWQSLGQSQWSRTGVSAQAKTAETQGYLVSPTTYDNFKLTVEFWVDDDTNSGVFIRCQNPTEINPDTCYEINIWDNHPHQPSRTGSIVKRSPPISHVNTIGQWNEMIIIANNNLINVSINNQMTSQFTDQSLDQGVIALQYFGKNRLHFRRLAIQPIK